MSLVSPIAPPPKSATDSKAALWEVCKVFLKLGSIGFGGTAALVAMMHEEVVRKRRWVDEQHFLDLLGVTNLLPGLSSTKLSMYLGFIRAGWLGMFLAGFFFILPATTIVTSLAWAYVQYGSLPPTNWLLYGIKPVIIAIVFQALRGLAKATFKRLSLVLIGGVVAILYLLGVNEIALLFGAGVISLLSSIQSKPGPPTMPITSLFIPLINILPLAAFTIIPYSLFALSITFMKIGAVLFGGAYVLLAFLRADFVERLHWLNDTQLIDAVAVGQFTPGPIFTTASFVGYIAGGFSGAIVAMISIVLPSVVFVIISLPFIDRIRRSLHMSALLDGVNTASVGLMGAVTWELGRAALVDVPTIALALAALVLLLYIKLNPVWLIIGGGLLSVGFKLVLG